MVKFAKKLQAVKKVLQNWNRQVFGKVDQNVRRDEDMVLKWSWFLTICLQEKNKIYLCIAKLEHNNMLHMEDQFWRQKANLKLVKEGDLNTKIFHHSVSHRRQKLFIHQISNSQGHLLAEQEEIKEGAFA